MAPQDTDFWTISGSEPVGFNKTCLEVLGTSEEKPMSIASANILGGSLGFFSRSLGGLPRISRGFLRECCGVQQDLSGFFRGQRGKAYEQSICEDPRGHPRIFLEKFGGLPRILRGFLRECSGVQQDLSGIFRNQPRKVHFRVCFSF